MNYLMVPQIPGTMIHKPVIPAPVPLRLSPVHPFARPTMLRSCFCFLLFSSFTRSTKALPSLDGIPAQAWKSANLGQIGEVFQSTRRLLEASYTSEEASPPQRQCGQVIGTASVDEIISFLTTGILKVLSNSSGLSTFITLGIESLIHVITFSVQAQVVCGSCDEIFELYAGEEFLNARGTNSFFSYCGPERNGHDAMHSALLLVPIDNLTSSPPMRQLPTAVFMHGTTVSTQLVPSEYYPSDLSTFIDLNADDQEQISLFLGLYDVVAAIFASANGVVSIAPDYIGYGQSYLSPKSYAVINMYQQAAGVSWLKAKTQVERSTNGCTTFQKAVTIAGYSEGGFSAVAAALALQAMNISVTGVATGGAPFDPAPELQFVQNQVDNNPNHTWFLNVLVPLLGNSYSSTNADLVNSDVSQDFLTSLWMEEGNFTMNVLAWMNSTQTRLSIYELIPADPSSMINQAAVTAMRGSIAAGGYNFCTDGNIGSDINLLCNALQSNSLVDELLAIPFPVTLCHSPDDEVIMQPRNISSNPNISSFNLLGMEASGSHFEAAVFCLLGFITPFTSFATFGGIGITSGNLPLGDTSVCMRASNISTNAPSSNPPTATSSAPLSFALSTTALLTVAFLVVPFALSY